MGSDGMTNKELMLQMFEISKSTAVQMTEMNAKIENIEKKVDEHEKILKDIPVMINSIEVIKLNTEKMEAKLDRSVTKSIQMDEMLQGRLEKLEKKSGEVALAVWKKIAVIVLTIAVTSGVNILINFLMKK